jgi:FtsH-binding integral membrane protein
MAFSIVAAWIAGATAALGLVDDVGDVEAWLWAGVTLAALLGATWCARKIRMPVGRKAE